MISFLNPLLLIGILGASIPVIIHLINRKKAISHQFAAIDFLLETQKRIRVRFKLRHLILMMLRACLVAFLAIALARPFVENFGAGALKKNIPTSNVIIIDDSYSMQYSDRTESFFHMAKTIAKGIVDNLTKEDNAAIITCSARELPVLPELEYNKNLLQDYIDGLQPKFTPTYIAPALDAAGKILATTDAPVKRVFLLTDLTRNGWDLNWFTSGQDRLKRHITGIHVIDISKGNALGNIAITDIESGSALLNGNGIARITVTVSNFSSTRVNNLLARIYANNEKVTQGFFNVDAISSETKHFQFYLKADEETPGWVEIGEDNLAVDNRRYFVIPPTQKLKVLLIDGDPKVNIFESETFYLERALNPGSEHISAIRPTVYSIHEINTIPFTNFDIVFLCNVETIPFEKIREMDSFVRNGGSVIITLGDKTDPDYYNNSLSSILPYELHDVKTFSGQSPLSEEQPLHLKANKPLHPTLKGISEADLSTLASAKFYRKFYIAPSPLGDSEVILSFSDDTPALVERRIERGKCILFTSSIDRDWTDFPVKTFFLPLMQQLCRYASGKILEEGYRGVTVGHEWQPPYIHSNGSIEIINPAGVKTVLQPHHTDSEKSFSYKQTTIPGIYAVTVDGKQHPRLPSYFSVNIDTIESNLERITRDEITALSGDIDLTVSSSHIGEERYTLMGEAKWTLWGTFLFLSLCVFAIESFLSRK